MGRRGPAPVEVVLSEDERATLERWAKRPKSEQSLALRCRIVLACAEGLGNTEVAVRLGVHPATVTKWRRRFVELRLDGLHDEPRPGVPRKFGDDDVEALVVKTLTEKPKDATHWSTRDMARATGMSQPTVARIWRAFGLKPWATDTFKLSEDPLFIEKVRDVVGIYMNPPPSTPWFVASTKRPASRPSIAPNPSCLCDRARSNVAPTTTSVTALPTCSPP
jgi:transposase